MLPFSRCLHFLPVQWQAHQSRGCCLCKGPLDIEPGPAKGRLVEGKATATGIIGIVTGDCSYDAAVKDALSRSPGATRLTNVQVDHHSRGILGIWAEFTTIVRGNAVK